MDKIVDIRSQIMTLPDKPKKWLKKLDIDSLVTWPQVTQAFVDKYYSSR